MWAAGFEGTACNSSSFNRAVEGKQGREHSGRIIKKRLKAIFLHSKLLNVMINLTGY